MTRDKDYIAWDNYQSNAIYFRNKALDAKTQSERLDALFNAKECQKKADELFVKMLKDYPV